MTKTLPSAWSIRWKKIENCFKDEVSRVEHTEWHSDRPTLNFINIDKHFFNQSNQMSVRGIVQSSSENGPITWLEL